jgi:SAM-dependent methyltransferase
MAPNEAERARWNSEERVRDWPKREQVTTAVTPTLIARLAPKPGERIADIGCGGGLAAMDAARAVGDSGAVTGFDLSEGLAALATRRAADAGIRNLRFASGDAQTDDIPGAPFDGVMSQFGVMFFQDPVAAFRNIRRQLKPDGRLVFACWQPAAVNTWFPQSVMMKYASAPPKPTDHGGPPPGPFAFGDAAYVRGILTEAGFTGIEDEQVEYEVDSMTDAMYDRASLSLLRLDPAREDAAYAELQEYAKRFRTSDGHVRICIRPQIISARLSG